MPEKDICQDLNNLKARDGLEGGGWNGGGRRRQSVDWTWTNFHCAFCLGVGCFIFFWIFLLLRMYGKICPYMKASFPQKHVLFRQELSPWA